jgi:hypothetical protein
MMANVIERHRDKIVSVLSCFDRLVPSVAYPQAVAAELDRRDIRLFDYAKQFALPFRAAIRARTEQLAAEEWVKIEYIQRIKSFRKEDRIQQILAERGNRAGWCTSFRRTDYPRHETKWRGGVTPPRRDCLSLVIYRAEAHRRVHFRPDGEITLDRQAMNCGGRELVSPLVAVRAERRDAVAKQIHVVPSSSPSVT